MGPTEETLIGGVSVAAVFAIIYAIIRLIRYGRKEYKNQLEEEEKVQEEKETRRRREAAEEAWEVVDMKQEEINRLLIRIEAVEARCNDTVEKCNDTVARYEAERRECEKELAYMSGRLQMIEAWAVAKGMKIGPSKPMEGGSGVHRPIGDK